MVTRKTGAALESAREAGQAAAAPKVINKDRKPQAGDKIYIPLVSDSISYIILYLFDINSKLKV
jgi:hypothetical protein